MRMSIGRYLSYCFATVVAILFLTMPAADSSKSLPTLATEDHIDSYWDEEFPFAFVLKEAGIKTGDNVADVGCEWGFFTYDLARQVGRTGKVFAVDINADMLEMVRVGVELYDLPQIVAIHGKPANPLLPEKALSHVVIANAYHEMIEYQSMLAGTSRSLKKDGWLIIIDRQSPDELSRQEYAKRHRIPQKRVIEELEENGFTLERIVSSPQNPTGEFYFLIFKPRT